MADIMYTGIYPHLRSTKLMILFPIILYQRLPHLKFRKMMHLHSWLCLLVLLFIHLPTRYAQVLPVTPEVVTYTCEELDTLEICSHVYRYASFPNYRGHSNQALANRELENFRPLIQSVCSNAIVHFLCSIYAPICIIGQENRRVRPCRELCTHVRSTCEPPLQRFNLEWPPHLECDNFAPDSETLLDFCPDNITGLPFPENITTIPLPPTGSTGTLMTSIPISETHSTTQFPFRPQTTPDTESSSSHIPQSSSFTTVALAMMAGLLLLVEKSSGA